MLPVWEIFFIDQIRHWLQPGARVLDIGGGLRIDGNRGNVVDASRAWMKPLIASTKYVIMDPVDTYHPDVVGDIHAMPFEADEWDVIICLAVLEHVQAPWQAAAEMYRVLRSSGAVIGYVPFLYPYHADPQYYGDYFRYTEQGVRALFSAFKSIEIVPVRGPIATLLHLMPWPRVIRPPMQWLGYQLDNLYHGSGQQVSGFNFVAIK